MFCAICGMKVDEIKARNGHLIVTKDREDGHVHVHGDLEDHALVKELMDHASAELGIMKGASDICSRKEIVFRNRQRIGDMLMFTCGVRDFKKAFPDVRVNVISTGMHIWDYNPYIDRTLVGTPDNEIRIGPGWLTNASNRLDWHFANAYRVSMEQALGVHIPQTDSRPDIWFSKDEYNAPRVTKDPYWIIVIGGEKGWGCKMYPFVRWQEFVNQNPDTLFYQLGATRDDHPRLQGKNVVDYVGKTEDRNTGIRDLFKLFLNAEGSIGLVSFHMHLSGALSKPSIVVAGAREPVSFTRYAGHQYLATDGCLPCAVSACWHCDIKACPHTFQKGTEAVPKCVDMITADDLTRALNNYYLGGRLQKGVASAKPKLRNVVDAPLQVAAPAVEYKNDEMTKYGIAFGGGALTHKDWDFLQYVIDKYKIKTVLEFGAGLSTLLLAEKVKVISYETNEGWIKKLKEINPELDIRLWDGTEASGIKMERFDMAFVDGPAGGRSREISTKYGASNADVVVVHDANRENERKWQEKYIVGKFKGPIKGGNRCHLWVKEPAGIGQNAQETGQNKAIGAPVVKDTGKFIKIVSTARGWGGCARSVTTIMKFLLDAGHKVEFIPFRNTIGSREYQECINKDLRGMIITPSYDTVREKCDVLLMYADDYIWEFGQPAIIEAFSEIGADRKIMMINYRRGEVGLIPWTKGWDKYMFLNSAQEVALKAILPGVKTKVLPPCTILTEFLKVRPIYDKSLHVVRHSSQGDTKFAKDIGDMINNVMAGRPDLDMSMLPGPSFVQQSERFHKVARTADPAVIAQFLSMGNLFWYSLPEGYMDMGPRVVLEAMAAGLPVLGDTWGGVTDRVTPESGWLTTKLGQVEILKNVTCEEIRCKGEAARERAMSEFVPERWVEEIVG